MAHRKEPSKKVLEKHAKFLEAWEAAGFPDHFGVRKGIAYDPAECVAM